VPDIAFFTDDLDLIRHHKAIRDARMGRGVRFPTPHLEPDGLAALIHLAPCATQGFDRTYYLHIAPDGGLGAASTHQQPAGWGTCSSSRWQRVSMPLPAPRCEVVWFFWTAPIVNL
jgi:hypothetical protein